MKKLLPILAALGACEPNFNECVKEKSEKLSAVVHSEDLQRFSESICNDTKAALDTNANGASSRSKRCENEWSRDRDCDIVGARNLSECTQEKLPMFEKTLEPGDAAELASQLCAEKEIMRKMPRADEDKIRIDFDLDGYSSQTDCDENNPAIHPYADEICDHIDNNCNEVVDLDNLRNGEEHYLTDGDFWHPDQDKDGYGVHDEEKLPLYTCKGDKEPEGMSKSPWEDCNDSDPSVNTGAVELRQDKKDNNCNELTDESTNPRPGKLPTEIEDSLYMYGTGRGSRTYLVPNLISPEQSVVREIKDLTPSDWTLEDLDRIKNDSISPVQMLGYNAQLALPAIEGETRTFCEWVTPLIDAEFDLLAPEFKKSALEILDHSQWYLSQYPAQLAKENTYYKALADNEEGCGKWRGGCEDYFIDYRPGSKWKNAERIREQNDALYKEHRESDGREPPNYSEPPKADTYRGVEAMLYRRIANGTNAKDLLYCANELEKAVKND